MADPRHHPISCTPIAQRAMPIAFHVIPITFRVTSIALRATGIAIEDTPIAQGAEHSLPARQITACHPEGFWA